MDLYLAFEGAPDRVGSFLVSGDLHDRFVAVKDDSFAVMLKHVGHDFQAAFFELFGGERVQLFVVGDWFGHGFPPAIRRRRW